MNTRLPERLRDKAYASYGVTRVTLILKGGRRIREVVCAFHGMMAASTSLRRASTMVRAVSMSAAAVCGSIFFLIA